MTTMLPPVENLVAKWRDEVCRNQIWLEDFHPQDHHDWYSLWVGFVIGIGRADLVAHDIYMEYGFKWTSADAIIAYDDERYR